MNKKMRNKNIEIGNRPQSLYEVAERTLSGHEFDATVREFLDEFYSHPMQRQVMINEEPPSLSGLQDAYLAAVAEHLAERWQIAAPNWVNNKNRFFA